MLAKGQLPPGDNPALPGWYQRPLPPNLVPFSSNRGKQLFKEAVVRGGMEGYFALAEQFQTQSTPSCQTNTTHTLVHTAWTDELLPWLLVCTHLLMCSDVLTVLLLLLRLLPDCGPGTLAMVLNALALDPKRLWKGNWRWFSEEMLETCDARKPQHEPLAGVENEGLSFEEFLFLAECNGANVRAFRAAPEGAATTSSASLSRFRAAIHSATHRTDLHLVASFSRKVLGQTGSGHYSPIGGYHAEADLALVLDVARFKYPPYWAPVPLLWKAVCDIDKATGQGRGYYLMSKSKVSAPVAAASAAAAASGDTVHAADHEHAANIFTPLSTACRIAVDKASWSRLAEHFCSVLPTQLQQAHEQGKFCVTGAPSAVAITPAAVAALARADASTLATPSTPSDTASGSAVSDDPAAAGASAALDAQCGLVFRQVLHSLPVELSSIFIMYTHDLNQRMIEQYQRRHVHAHADQAHPDHAHAHAHAHAHTHTHTHSHTHTHRGVTGAASSACTATHSCEVHHPSKSSLSVYHTCLPKHTPHNHSHSIPTVHALYPLLHAIAGTRLFALLQQADIDLQTVEYKHSRPAPGPSADHSQPLATGRHADSSAVGGLGFHLLASSADGELELAALLLLACPQQVFSLLPAALQSRLSALRHFDSLPPALQTEVGNLRSQMGILADFCLCGAAPSVEGNANPNVDPQDLIDNVSHNRRSGEETLARALACHSHADSRDAADHPATAPVVANPAPLPVAAPAQPAPVAHRFVAGTRSKSAPRNLHK